MTVLEDVAALVKQLAPHGICDDCIADRLPLSIRQHAHHKTRELARDYRTGFHREKDMCNICKRVKLVIWYGPNGL